MRFVGGFHNETYQANIRIINPATLPQLLAYLRSWDKKPRLGKFFNGYHDYLEHPKGNFHIIVIRAKWDDSTQLLGSLSHESVHVAESILWMRGQKHTPKSSEAFSYLQGSIFRRSLELLRGEVKMLHQ